MQKHNFFVKQIFFQDEVEILTFFDGDDDFGFLTMKMNIAVTQSIFMLGPPDFTWKQIQIIATR